MKILNYLFAAVLCVALSSCLGSNSEKLVTTSAYTSGQNCSYVEDITTGKGVVIATGAAYTMQVNFTESFIDLSVSGLQLIPGGASYSFNLKEQKFTFDKTGSILVNVPSYIDTQNNVTITNFQLRFLDRQIMVGSMPMSNPGWAISYEVNGQYKVTVVQLVTYYFGKSDVTVLATGSNTKTTETYYCLTIDPKTIKYGSATATGNFYLYNAQFATTMPKMNMMLKDVPIKIDGDGLVMDAKSLKLYVTETVEQPDFAVTDFYGTVDFDAQPDTEGSMHNVDIDFVCGGRFSVKLDLGFIYKLSDK